MNLTDTGLDVIDLQTDTAFAARRLRTRHLATPIDGANRLARVLIESPDTILQELADAAIELCGADSAGISMEIQGGTDEKFYEWVATAGEYSKFLHALLPRLPSACGVCLERGTPQLFRVRKRFFDSMGVKAPEVTDGILLPWHLDGARGTIWIMAHGRTEAFDSDDVRIVQVLANITAMGVRQQGLLGKPGQSGASTTAAHDLAKRFDNSLQTMKNTLHMAAWSQTGAEARKLSEEMTAHLQRLSALAGRLLKTPGESSSRPN